MTVVAGADRLLSDLEARARAEVEAVRAEARAETERIRAGAEEQCASLKNNAMEACAAGLAPAFSTARFAASQAARRLVLEAQHCAIRRVLEAVPALACGQASCDAADTVIAARVADVLSYLGGRPGELCCAATILPRVQASLPEGAQVRVVADPGIAAGIRAASADGRVVVDDTLEAWLVREAASLTIAIRDAIAGAGAKKADVMDGELIHA